MKRFLLPKRRLVSPHIKVRLRAILLAWLLLPMLALAEPLSIAQFKRLAPTAGEFEIIGYIAKQYRCPPCPPETACKPCMKNNILLSQVGELLHVYPSAGDYLVIFTEEPENLILGKRYVLKVEVLRDGTTRFSIRDLRLIEAEKEPRND